MPQQHYICPIAKLSCNTFCSVPLRCFFSDTSSENRKLHIRLHGNTPFFQSQVILALADELEKGHKNVCVFFDYFENSLAVKLEYENVTVSGEKAGARLSLSGQIEIDVGANCDASLSKLSESRVRADCAALHLKASDFLAIASKARLSRNKIASKCFLEEKARAALERIARERIKKHGRTNESKGTSANQGGRQTVSSLCGFSGNSVSPPADYLPYYIKDKVHSVDLFIPLLCEISDGYDKTVLLSEPLENAVSAIFVPEAEIAFIPYDADGILHRDKHALDYKIINLERFCDTAKLKQNKAELKFLRKCEDEFSACALECMAKANKIETDFYNTVSTENNSDQNSIAKTVSEITELIRAHLMQKS